MDLKERLAKAVISRDVMELTKIVAELEGSEECEKKILRAEALIALGMYLAPENKDVGLKYIREGIEEAFGCNDDSARRIVADGYAYLLMYDKSVADEALEKLDPKDPAQAPVYALALGMKGDKRCFEILEGAFGSYKAALYGLLVSSYFEPKEIPDRFLVDIIRESFRYQTFKGLERIYYDLIHEALERTLTGDDKAKVYALAGYLLSDKSLAMTGLKAARSDLVKDFAHMVVAELMMEENPEMAHKYASKIKERDDPRGAFITASSRYILSKKDVSKLLLAESYALKAYIAGLYRQGLSSTLVEPLLALISRIIAYIAYKTSKGESRSVSEIFAKALETPCSLIDTFTQYKPMMAKACACARKVLGRDPSKFLKIAKDYSDRILDECLS